MVFISMGLIWRFRGRIGAPTPGIVQKSMSASPPGVADEDAGAGEFAVVEYVTAGLLEWLKCCGKEEAVLCEGIVMFPLS